MHLRQNNAGSCFGFRDWDVSLWRLKLRPRGLVLAFGDGVSAKCLHCLTVAGGPWWPRALLSKTQAHV